MDNELDQEARKVFAGKDELERTISVGIEGAPEINHAERLHYLGELRERVLKVLTKNQVMKAVLCQELTEALKDSRASKMLINGDIDYKFTDKYRKMAVGLGKHYTIIHDPELDSDTGLVIISETAVDEDNIYVTE